MKNMWDHIKTITYLNAIPSKLNEKAILDLVNTGLSPDLNEPTFSFPVWYSGYLFQGQAIKTSAVIVDFRIRV